MTLISSNPPDATSLAEAACDQSFVSKESAVAVVTTGSEDGDVDVAEAWSVGAAGSGLHLATTAARLVPCTRRRRSPRAPESTGAVRSRTGHRARADASGSDRLRYAG